MTTLLLSFIAEASGVIIPEPQRQMSLAAEVVLILATVVTVPTAVLIATALWKIWKERTAIYERVDLAQKDVDRRLDDARNDVDRRFDAGKERFARIEQDLAEVKASMKTHAARTADGNRAIAKIEQKVDRLDERLDGISNAVASSTAKVEQVVDTVNKTLGEMTKFFTDSQPGRGITARLKKAVREIVRPEALTHADETVYPEETNDVYLASPRPRPKSSPALEPLGDETQEFKVLPPVHEKKTNPPKAFDHDAQTRPLMRRKPPNETA